MSQLEELKFESTVDGKKMNKSNQPVIEKEQNNTFPQRQLRDTLVYHLFLFT